MDTFVQSGKTVNQRFGANLKKRLFENFAANYMFFLLFSTKTLKMTISTSVWSAQHPNAGRNIQQTLIRNIGAMVKCKFVILDFVLRYSPLELAKNKATLTK